MLFYFILFHCKSPNSTFATILKSQQTPILSFCHMAETDDAHYAPPPCPFSSPLFLWTSLPSVCISSNSRVLTPRNSFLSLFPSDYFRLTDFSRVFLLQPTMLCSAPAGKSGSNWLDRLRSIKGIPTGDDLDLDSFLTNQSISSDSLHSISDHTILLQKQVRNRTRASEPSTVVADPPMSSVLADLFNMGGSLSQSSKLSGKKCPRKQTNPKFFVASSRSNSSIDCARKDGNNVPATNSSDNDGVDMKEENTVCWDGEEEKEKDGNELKGFSKSEVTVIDTSCPEWKVEKFVFRKNNVWKVREKKGKSKFFGKKKRKGTFGFDSSNGRKKELKLLESQFGSSVETNTEEFITQSTQGQIAQQEMKEIPRDTPEDDLPPKKRFPFSRNSRKSRKENTSVIQIKAIPT